MALIITAADGQIVMQNTAPDAETGRWCAAPLSPDTCDCFESDRSIYHARAEGYRVEYEYKGSRRFSHQGKGTIEWRFGICHKCASRYDPATIHWYTE